MASSGSGADRHGSGETGHPDDPWQRIETEKPQRDAARKAWDAEHDPSPEYEYAIRPLGSDYGKDRPASRDLTEAQRAELAEVFGRPADELLALRDKDPRAAHNRDHQGRILDHDGNPRVEKTPEQILREAQRQANLYGPDATSDVTESRETPDLRSRSDTPGESGGDSEPNQPHELGKLVSDITADLRTGKLTTGQAAEILEQFRDRLDSARTEPTSETVREQDGYRYELGVPEELPDDDFELDDISSSGADKLRSWASRRETIGDIDDAGRAWGRSVDGLFGQRPQPTGSYVDVTPDVPVIKQAPRDSLDGGALFVAPVVLYLLGDRVVRSMRSRLREHSAQEETRSADH